jgi:hypothetical protein
LQQGGRGLRRRGTLYRNRKNFRGCSVKLKILISSQVSAQKLMNTKSFRNLKSITFMLGKISFELWFER